jgi:Skp family chaperone for outer membrane proteins
MSTATNDRAPRAPAVAVKLAEAEAQLLELEAAVAPLALAELEGVAGAKRDLQALEAKIEAAKRERHKLRSAHRHAVELDRKADIADAATLRQEQLRIFKVHAQSRLKSLQTVMDAIATAAPAFSTYAIETGKMVAALPTGTNIGIVGMGRNNWAGSWLGDCANLIAAEAYRLAVPDKTGRGARLPFAQAPDLSTGDVAKIVPAIDLMSEAQDHVMREIEGQMERLNREALAVISKPEALKEAV